MIQDLQCCSLKYSVVLLPHCFIVPYFLQVIDTKGKEMVSNPYLMHTLCLDITFIGKLKAKEKGAWQWNYRNNVN